VVDDDISPEVALELIPRMAASFQMRSDPLDKFAEMGSRGAREEARVAAARELARETLVRAGFGDAAPGKPQRVQGVYAEWMEHPEPRYQLVKPLGLLRTGGAAAVIPSLRDAQGKRLDLRGSIGWRAVEEGTWASTNRDNGYLPLPGIDEEFARLHTDENTALYFFATTVRIEHADESAIAGLNGFFEELPEVERAWQQGTLVSGERLPLPAPEAASQIPLPESLDNERFCFGIDLQTGTPHLDSLRGRLCAAARRALSDVRAGRFDLADAQVRAIDSDIQSAVMLGAMYTEALRRAVSNGERESRPDYVSALHERALRWRLSAYPDPHTAHEADDYEAGRAADRAKLAAILAAKSRD
jgi:hypothetical protein